MTELTDKLVKPGEKPELSPNPDGSGYVKQIEVDALTDVVSPEENVLYVVEGKGYKYLAAAIVDPGTNKVLVPAGFIRVAQEPSLYNVDGGRETPVKENTTPKEAPEKVFNGLVIFNGEIYIKGKKLEDYIDAQGGVTEEELKAAIQNSVGVIKLTDIHENSKIKDFYDAGYRAGVYLIDGNELLSVSSISATQISFVIYRLYGSNFTWNPVSNHPYSNVDTFMLLQNPRTALEIAVVPSSSSNILSILSPTQQVIFRFSGLTNIYIGSYESGKVEIESLSGPERWVAAASPSDTFASVMIDANRADYVVGKEGIPYLTTAPVAANTNGKLIFVVLSEEPATKYDGYVYIITGA